MVFSSRNRTDLSPRSYTESIFSYIDRSARPEYYKVRSLIEAWLANVPNNQQSEFCARMQSCDNLALHSAFFELYTHELLRATGHTVEFHPELEGVRTRPDFLATDSSGNKVVVECTVATEESSQERSAQARLNQLYDAIERVNCKDVFLDLQIDGAPESPVKLRDWQAKIQRWVDTLNYEALLAMGRIPQESERPRLELAHNGLQLTIKAIPKKESARGKDQRSIGVQSFEGRQVDSHKKIKETIRDKAGRYGTLSLPYVIVVNCLGELADEEEMHDAMFGRCGAWSEVKKPTYTRVSAVLGVLQLLPWSVAASSARMFLNPNGLFPYSGKLELLPRTTCKSETNGMHPRDLFGIAPSWPYGLTRSIAGHARAD